MNFNDIPKNRLELFLKELKIENSELLFEAIGLGNQVASLVAQRLCEDIDKIDESHLRPLAIRGTEGMVVSYAKCCRPIPGDPIVGHLSSGRGIVIHRESCKNISEIHRFPEKYIYVKWGETVEGEFLVNSASICSINEAP